MAADNRKTLSPPYPKGWEQLLQESVPPTQEIRKDGERPQNDWRGRPQPTNKMKGTTVSPSAAAGLASTTPEAIRANLSLVHEELAIAAARVDEQQLVALAAELQGAGRVFVAGAGRSGLVLRMAAMRLMHLGMVVHVAGDTTTPAFRAGDLLLVASGSGTPPGILNSSQTAAHAGAHIAAITANAASPLADLADTLVVIPAAQKTDHGTVISRQYSGSLFEQALLIATESVFQTLWAVAAQPAEELWLRHANLE